MRLKKIKNKNFCSFEDTELELLQNSSDKNAIYLIHGINKDITDDSPEETSNGSGKSTIIGESVTFNLFNRPLRGDKKKSKIDQLIKRQDITNTVKGKSKGSVLFNEVEYFVNDDKVRTAELPEATLVKFATTWPLAPLAGALLTLPAGTVTALLPT